MAVIDPIAVIRDLTDAARMSARKTPVTLAFYVGFALWFTGTRYSSPSFYGWLLSPIVGDALELGTVALFLMVIVIVGRRAIRAASFPWLDVAVSGGAIAASDLFWRFYLSRDAGEAQKLTSIAVDVASPALAALGLAALLVELRRPTTAIAE